MPSSKRSHGWANWRLRQLEAAFGGYITGVAFGGYFWKRGIIALECAPFLVIMKFS